MTKPNGLFIAMLIAGLIAGGCSTSAPDIDPVICEYPPAKLPSQATVDEAGVFALVQWPTTGPATPGAERDSTDPSTDYLPAKELASDVCVNLGDSIGFRVEHNQLIAFAGTTTMPLMEGHYGWILISSPANGRRPSEQKPLDLAKAIWLATIIAVVKGLVWLLDRFGNPSL